MTNKTQTRAIQAHKHTCIRPLASSLISSVFLLASGATSAEEALPLQLASADTVEVIGQKAAGFKADKLSSDKFTQPLLDTPQTLVVVKKELFEQQAATTLSETLRNTPGITLLMGENGNTATGDSIFMRGFDTQGSIFVDGIRDLGTLSRDTYNTEQVEIAKGPAGVDNGRGAASGYVNLSSKMASLKDSSSANLTAGDGSFKRASLDVNQSLAIDNAALRVNLMRQDSGIAGRDAVENNLGGIATSLGLGLGTDTRSYINLLHNQQRGIPDGGVPTFGLDGYYSSVYAAAFPNNSGPALTPVDASHFYGSLSDHNTVDATMATLRIEHDVSPNLSLRNSTRFGRSSQDLELTGVNTLVIPDKTDMASWQVLRTRQGKQQTNQILTNQTNLNAKLMTFGVQHELAAGVEVIGEQQLTRNLVVPWSSPTATTHLPQTNANLFNPDTGDSFQPLVSDGTQIRGETTTAALYALDTISLNSQWQLSAGLRAERFYTTTDQIIRQVEAKPQTIPVGTLLGRQAELADSLLSWKLGAVYKPAANGSVYISTASSQLPPGSNSFLSQGAFALNTDSSTVTANNASLDPQRGTNQELGTKWNVFNNKLALTAAVFRSSNSNEVVTNPDTSVTPVGERQVQGLELGMAGIVMQNWQISAGLALMEPEIKKGSSGSGSSLASLDGGAIQWSPKKSFTLWNSYAFGGGFTLGGGVRYIDSVVSSSIVDPAKLATRSMVSVPEYWVLDAMAAYQINSNISVQLNVYNLADEQYIASVNNSGARYYPGTPRSARLGVNVSF